MSNASHTGLIPVIRFVTALVVGIGLTIATGVVCGQVSQRWGPVPDLVAAGRQLEQLPTQFGDWQLSSDEPIDEGTVRMLSCAGHVNRRYVNRRTGDTVSLAITVGPAGPISVHTPEICYSSRAYSIQEKRKRKKIASANRTHTFWDVAFRSSSASAEQLRVYYGWCADTTWTAAESPRFEYAGRPLLYKLQMACLIPMTADKGAPDPCEDFLTAFLNSGWKFNG